MIMDGEGVNIIEEKQKEENQGIFEGFLHLATELGNDYQEQENIERFGEKGFENGQGIDLLKEVEEPERGGGDGEGEEQEGGGGDGAGAGLHCRVQFTCRWFWQAGGLGG